MVINELLKQKGMTKYRLAKESCVPHTTVLDICNGKTSIGKCKSITLYKLAKTLNVSMEYLIEYEVRPPFEAFKSSICHRVKNLGDLDFIIETLESDKIRELYNKEWKLESLYLLAMVDYLSRENDLPICSNYNDLRRMKFSKPVYPSGIIAMSVLAGNDEAKRESIKNAIPEFIRFNIVESDIRNVV